MPDTDSPDAIPADARKSCAFWRAWCAAQHMSGARAQHPEPTPPHTATLPATYPKHDRHRHPCRAWGRCLAEVATALLLGKPVVMLVGGAAADNDGVQFMTTDGMADHLPALMDVERAGASDLKDVPWLLDEYLPPVLGTQSHVSR
eukprot:3917777-Prymnesium_polylepis.2